MRDKRESRHSQVSVFYQNFRRQRGTVYTSDYVLDETITLLFRRLSFPLARKSLENIEQAITAEYLRLERITPERFEKAKGLRKKFQDKPLISFTDLTSMVVMEECGIVQVLTEDERFLHVGMGFQRIL